MRKLIGGLDTETTGLDYEKGDRIIEVCLQVWDFHERKPLTNFTQRINPVGQRISAKAQKVHGITAADLVGKPVFKEVAPKLDAMLKRCEGVVTHNGEWFDLPFLAHEFAQVGVSLPSIESFDTMQNGMFASYDTKPPRLEEFCWAMGVEYDPAKAHAADYDVDVMMKGFFNAADLGYFDVSEFLGLEEAA